MNEKKITKIYRAIQYNQMENSKYSNHKDRLSRRATEWMHQKPYGMKEVEEREQN